MMLGLQIKYGQETRRVIFLKHFKTLCHYLCVIF